MTQLTVYNNALSMIGSRELASLTENRESKRALDSQYPQALKYCLEQAIWTFALRTVQPAAGTLPTINYGYPLASVRPVDCVHTYLASPDALLATGTQIDILEADGYYFSQVTPIYVRYVSNDVAYGGNEALWPEAFSNYLSTRLAAQVCYRLTRNLDLSGELVQMEEQALMIARSQCALVSGSIGIKQFNMIARREDNPGSDPQEIFPFSLGGSK